MSAAVDPVETLQVRYEALRDRYDRAAIRFKWFYRVASVAAHLCTWLTLLSVLFALAQPAGSPVPHVVLHVITPIFGSLGIVATLVLWIDLQGRWKFYRFAAESLRGESMRFRAGLSDYGKPGAADVLGQTLGRIAARADSRRGEPLLDLWRRAFYWDLAWLPFHLREKLSHAPDGAQPLRRTTEFAKEERAVLHGRLDSQERWHLLRARQFFRRWLFGFQLPILLIHAGNIYLGVFVDRFLWAVGFSTSLSLMLYAMRDLLDYGPLFGRYLRVAGNLRDVRAAYLARVEPFNVADDAERLRLLAQYVERILAIESEYWYASCH